MTDRTNDAGTVLESAASSALTGAKLGSVVPVFGTAIGAVIGWVEGIATTAALSDPFGATPEQATSMLAVLSVDPELIYAGEGISGLEGLEGAAMPRNADPKAAVAFATNLFQWAGITPSGALTNEPFLARVLAAGKASKGAPSAPLATNAAEASAYLALLRAHGPGVQWALPRAAPMASYRQGFVTNVKRLRSMAGESGADTVLGGIVGGDVTTPAVVPARDPKVAGITPPDSAPPSAPLITPGRVALFALVAAACGGLWHLSSSKKR